MVYVVVVSLPRLVYLHTIIFIWHVFVDFLCRSQRWPPYENRNKFSTIFDSFYKSNRLLLLIYFQFYTSTLNLLRTIDELFAYGTSILFRVTIVNFFRLANDNFPIHIIDRQWQMFD